MTLTKERLEEIKLMYQSWKDAISLSYERPSGKEVYKMASELLSLREKVAELKASMFMGYEGHWCLRQSDYEKLLEAK